MMNSFEFDQPLDLRLKALNLSLSTCKKQQILIQQQPPTPLPPSQLQPQQNHQNHYTRSLFGANIHCQPLNHHQPHPLSRLHPPPSYLQQQQQQQQNQHSANPKQAHHLYQNHLHHHHQQNYNQPPTIQPLMRSSPPASHQQMLQSSFSLPPRDQPLSQQSSPQSQSSPVLPIQQQQQQHYPVYHPMPVKSLSISGHHSFNSSGFGLNQLTSSPNNQTLDLNKSSSSVSVSTSGSASVSASASPSDSSVASTTATTGTTTTNQSTAAPITRQHSLVSRYNCKPCGIVFSQPETLRAHQEGYCTKRERSHTVQAELNAFSV